MRKITRGAATVAAVGSLALGSLAISGTSMAGVPDCSSGSFCAWQHSDYEGHRESWFGDDRYWGNNDNINNQDSSWENNGQSGPGIADHVKVYDGYFLSGGMTICLRPGDEVIFNPGANDRGSSHTWTSSC